MIKCFCINDKRMPNDYPDVKKWVKEGEMYHIIRVLFLNKSNTLAVQLNEIDMEDVPPYFGWFRIDRFGIPEEHLEQLQRLIDVSKEEQEVDFDFNELLKNLEIVN